MDLLFLIGLIISITLVLILTLTGTVPKKVQEVFVTGYYAGETFFKDEGNGSGTGATLPDGTGNSSFLAKYSNSGSVEWAARQDGAGDDVGNGVATDSQNNVFMAGRSGPTGITFYSKQTSGGLSVTLPGDPGIGFISFLAKYSNSGIVSWAARQEGAAGAIGYGVTTDSQNNVFITGQNGATGVSFYNARNNDDAIFTLPSGTLAGSFLAKYSNTGSVDWAARQDGGANEAGFHVATDSQTNVFITGRNGSSEITFYSKQTSGGLSVTLPSGTGNGSFLAKYTNNGIVDWAARQDGPGSDAGRRVATDSQNNVYMTGDNGNSEITFYSKQTSGGLSITLPGGAGSGSFLARYSNSGLVEWAARQDGGGDDVGRGVATDSQNNVYMTGENGTAGITFYSKQTSGGLSVTLPPGANDGSFLAKYTNNGIVDWAARQAGGGTNVGYGVDTDSQNNVYMTGDFAGSGGISFYNQGSPNDPVFTLEKLGASDDSTFTSKYNSKGEFQWAAVIGSTVAGELNAGYSIATT